MLVSLFIYYINRTRSTVKKKIRQKRTMNMHQNALHTDIQLKSEL